MTAPIRRIEEALAELGNEHVPPDGWEAKVLEGIQRTRRNRWWLFAVPILALAVLLFVVQAGSLRGAPAGELALAMTYDKTGPRARLVVHPSSGDFAHAKATGGGRFRAVWIYRDDKLVTACPARPHDSPRWCRADGDQTVADVALTLGAYTIVALTSELPLLPPQGNYDEDVARATETGAVTKMSWVTIK